MRAPWRRAPRLLAACAGVLVSSALLGGSGVAFPQDQGAYFPQRISAQDLLTACASSALTGTGRERRRYCYGFISGVEESARLRQLQTPLAAGFCVPPSTSSRNMAEAFTAFAARPDTELNRPAASVVLAALAAMYPCQRARAR